MTERSAFENFLVKGAFSSASNEWATPVKFYEELNEEFDFVLDVAASRTNRKCTLWFGLDNPDNRFRDGLSKSWLEYSKGKPIFMNPPYGKEIRKWMRKANEEAAKGCTVVCLVPARTDTQWFHESCLGHEIRYIKGRLKFNDGPTVAPFPSIVVVMRPTKNNETKTYQRRES
jgi:phage N-6-adenine-methyltransferase